MPRTRRLLGSGGYNAELLAHIVGGRGRVVTVDLDPYVVQRTGRLCAEAGNSRVTAVLGDGGRGAPAHVPAGGLDGIVIKHTATDIAPAWRDQLAEGGRLVVPLQIGGHTRSVTLVRGGDTLHAEHWTYCGFVRDRGAAARTAPMVRLADGAVTVRWENGVLGAYGPAGPEPARRFAACVRTWDRNVRTSGYPAMSVHPAGTPDDRLPPGDVLEMPASRLVLGWPGRGARVTGPDAPAETVVAGQST
ncbi:hypothetical protein ACFYWO_22915 [Streptomyces sp. NPDC002932]|uniref:hypothetical protein n=1 Tax=Streptomyces sp. NPDC002932 TaxID=3364672 RepID=UPI0036968551